jgi:hypothetical protein
MSEKLRIQTSETTLPDVDHSNFSWPPAADKHPVATYMARLGPGFRRTLK